MKYDRSLSVMSSELLILLLQTVSDDTSSQSQEAGVGLGVLTGHIFGYTPFTTTTTQLQQNNNRLTTLRMKKMSSMLLYVHRDHTDY